MDFDALVNVKRIIATNSTVKTDLMLLTSAINNHNVDINLSIRANIDIIREFEVDNHEFMTYLSEFAGLNEELLNTPIYALLIKNSAYWQILLSSLKSGLLVDETYTAIVRYLFELISNVKEEELNIYITFLHDILSVKKVKFIRDETINQDIVNFIISNIDSIEYTNEEVCSTLIIKSIIIKMFIQGIVSFSDLFFCGKHEFILVQYIIESLLDIGEYYNIYAILNHMSVDIDTAPVLVNILKNSINSRGEKASNELMQSCIDKLNSIGTDAPKNLQ